MKRLVLPMLIITPPQTQERAPGPPRLLLLRMYMAGDKCTFHGPPCNLTHSTHSLRRSVREIGLRLKARKQDTCVQHSLIFYRG